MEASREGNETVVTLLIEKGANLDIQDKVSILLSLSFSLIPIQIGDTPLIAASRSGNERVVSLLIERGANLDIQNDDWLVEEKRENSPIEKNVM